MEKNMDNQYLEDQSAPAPAIIATLVTDANERLGCLPAIAGAHCVVLESAVYDFMRDLCPQYDDGFWHFYRLSNGGFYMAPDSGDMFKLSSPNGFVHDVSADTAGVVACGFAYSHMSFRRDGQRFARAYHQLAAYIWQRPDVDVIQAALD
jgi:Antirestriction protein